MTLLILLFTVGILLLAAEVIVPGGILGLVGGVLLFTGCIVAFVSHGLGYGLAAVAITVLAGSLVFFVQFKVLPKTRFGRRFFLDHTISGTAAGDKNEWRDLIGKTAKSVTILSPSGYVEIDGKRYDASSESGQIPAGIILEVISANEFQITVRIQSPSSHA